MPDNNKKENLKLKGEVIQALPNTLFKVKLETGSEIIAHLAGRLRLNFIRILPGDKVLIEMTPYDLTKGRIVFRYK